jgi:glycosyltransferase involved in cell wall biosynthesis
MPITLAHRISVQSETPVQSNTRLKILLVSHKFPPFMGGIETHTYEVGRRMAANGHSVTVLTCDPSGALAREEMVAGTRVLRVAAYPKSSDVFFGPGVYREIVRGTWDIVHIQGFHTFVPPLAMLAALRRSACFVMTFHSGGHSSPARNIIRGVQRKILSPLMLRADMLIAVSEFEADHFARDLGIPRSRIIVVPNGAEIEAARETAPPHRTHPLILSVGRLERYKGHHRVIAAFAEVLKRRPRAQLRVLGEGPYKPQLLELVRKLALQNSVTIGAIPPEQRRQMATVLSEASVVALLSDYEAHPVAALEAISLGCRVLASNSTGFAEMAANGLLHGIDPKASPRAIADAIIAEIDSPATTCSPRIKINNWDDCTSDLLKVYHCVLMHRKETRPIQQSESGSGTAIKRESKRVESECVKID